MRPGSVSAAPSTTRRVAAAPPFQLDGGAVWLARQPCQPQLIMHPHQRVRLRSLLVIRHHQLGTPRPLSRMPPLQEPPVSAPIRRREPLPHRSGGGAALRSACRSCALDKRSALRSCLDPGQRCQSPNRARARVVACENGVFGAFAAGQASSPKPKTAGSTRPTSCATPGTRASRSCAATTEPPACGSATPPPA